jgi:hypothetical protein
MDANRRQYLYDQFVLTLQNESEWYRRACAILRHPGGMSRFRTLTDEWVHNYVGRWNCDDLNAMEYAYIQMELFEYLKGHILDIATVISLPLAWRRCRHEIEVSDAQARKAKREEVMKGSETTLDEAIEHLKNANETLLDVEEKFNAVIEEAKEKNAMNNIPFITKNYVFGQDVANMTEDQLIAAIKKMEGEIADLKAVKTKSKKIEQMIKDAEDGLAKIVEVLDAK